VAISIRRVDLTQEELNKPVPPPAPGEAAAQFGPTAALNLLTALSDLRNTQNNFMSVWLNYYATRMRLMREMGVMQLDAEGRWIDAPLTVPERPSPEEIATPPAVPVEWLELVSRPESDGAPAEGQAGGPANPLGLAAEAVACRRLPSQQLPSWPVPAAYQTDVSADPAASQAIGVAAAWMPVAAGDGVPARPPYGPSEEPAEGNVTAAEPPRRLPSPHR
jgi:hypothetical protein